MNVLIIGSGRLGSDIGKRLSTAGHNIVIIDSDPESFKKLGAAFNGLTNIGTGTDEILLRESGAEKTDVFLALTDKDNINIMASQIAVKIFNIPKVIAKINDPAREKAFQNHGFSIVSSTNLVTMYIWDEISSK